MGGSACICAHVLCVHSHDAETSVRVDANADEKLSGRGCRGGLEAAPRAVILGEFKLYRRCVSLPSPDADVRLPHFANSSHVDAAYLLQMLMYGCLGAGVEAWR